MTFRFPTWRHVCQESCVQFVCYVMCLAALLMMAQRRQVDLQVLIFWFRKKQNVVSKWSHRWNTVSNSTQRQILMLSFLKCVTMYVWERMYMHEEFSGGRHGLSGSLPSVSQDNIFQWTWLGWHLRQLQWSSCLCEPTAMTVIHAHGHIQVLKYKLGIQVKLLILE